MRLGFIGTGTIAAAFIAGLQRKGTTHEMVVSPRSEAVSLALVEEFPTVRRALSNAAVVADSDVIFLGMRPAQLEEALAGLAFSAGQTVVSFVARLGLDELQALAPEARVARVIPLPAIEYGQGPVMCYPALPDILDLLDGMGEVVIPQDEAQFSALTSVSGFMSSYFELQLSLVDWVTEAGVERETAGLYVRSLLASLAQTALRTPGEKLGDLPEEHQTKGGLNQRVRQALLDGGWFDMPKSAFEAIANASRTGLT